ncbi:MAG: hypothetical protein KA204_00590 [Chromatiaceae bacterium]|nr:hypothetical protein [Chromatiaceae bacterium]MBP6733792.1 hypothetical protein [Chromatiaceae bacterium]MBP8283070.1 hypothetical protein [Chromatiaceae bacterium]MBP8289230.1 hypothetical protein [Chromatiaceae bacterium]
MHPLMIRNQGLILAETNYWDSPHAQAGYFYLSWNAGTGRLLIPDAQKALLRELRVAREVIVSRGPWVSEGGRDALELLWEDGSGAPYAVLLVAEQTDRLIPDYQQGGGFVITAWTRTGQKGRWPGRYRVVAEIPCLAAWSIH